MPFWDVGQLGPAGVVAVADRSVEPADRVGVVGAPDVARRRGRRRSRRGRCASCRRRALTASNSVRSPKESPRRVRSRLVLWKTCVQVGAAVGRAPDAVAEHRRVERVGVVRVELQLGDPALEPVDAARGRASGSAASCRWRSVDSVKLRAAVGRPVDAERGRVRRRAPAAVDRRRAVARDGGADADRVRVARLDRDRADRAVGGDRGASRARASRSAPPSVDLNRPSPASESPEPLGSPEPA